MASMVSHPADRPVESGRFYYRMAGACVAIAFLGFTPSYFVPLARGGGGWPLVIHVHGLLFFIWVLFFWWQTWLIVNGRRQHHRAWGLVGIGLAVSMVSAAFMVVASRAASHQAAGFVVEGRSFAWIAVSDLLIFAGILAAAVANVGKPETHKRLMLMATISLLGPPIGRWVLLGVKTFTAVQAATPGAPPPVTAGYLPHALSFTLVAIAMARDRRTIGRIHPAYVASFAVMVLQLLTLTTIASSPSWQRIAARIATVGG